MDTSKSVNFFVICEHYLVDNMGRSSLINIFDIIHSAQFPFIPLKFVVAFSANIKDDDFDNDTVKLRVELVDFQETAIVTAESHTKIQGSQRTLVSSIDLGGKIQFPKNGLYDLRLSIGDKVVAKIQFEAKKSEKGVES